MSNRTVTLRKSVPFGKIGDIRILPGDVAKLIRKPEVLLGLTNGELKEIQESIDLEINYRENGRWKN